MNRTLYEAIQRHMLQHMRDSAHDSEHIYRVLYAALDIAQTEPDADMDVLIAACLLHDVGREAQFRDPSVCHARAGSEMARAFLLELGWAEAKAGHVADCVRTHRYRTDDPATSLEAKILFDADKLDVSGALGIARTLIYQGHESFPLYWLDEEGEVSDGTRDAAPGSFMREYHFKLNRIYDRFYTQRGEELARARRPAAQRFYESLLGEARSLTRSGKAALEDLLAD